MNRIIPAAAVALAIVSTGVAVAFAAVTPAPSVPHPTPAGLVPQTYVTVTTTPSKAAAGRVAPSSTSGSSRVGGVQNNVTPNAPAEATTTAPAPMACGYPTAAPGPIDLTNPSAPRRTPAPTPTVTAVIPPDTCPPYVAFP